MIFVINERGTKNVNVAAVLLLLRLRGFLSTKVLVVNGGRRNVNVVLLLLLLRLSVWFVDDEGRIINTSVVVSCMKGTTLTTCLARASSPSS